MKTLSLATCLVLATALSLRAETEAETLAKQKANLPDAVRKIADQGDPGIPAGQVDAKAKAATAKATEATKADPASKWGKNEVHKVAVMEIKFGRGTETVMFELLPDAAPQTVANFIENVNAGAYKGLAFHRAIEGFLVQTGDPLTSDDSKRNDWGTGGEDKTVAGEFKLSHKVGAVAMARRSDAVNPDRRSNGYQFYFTLGNYGALDGSYAVFGQVVSGLETLQAISRVPVDGNDCPLSRIEVKSVRVMDQKGPLVVSRESSGSGHRGYTRSSATKTGFSKFFDRIW